MGRFLGIGLEVRYPGAVRGLYARPAKSNVIGITYGLETASSLPRLLESGRERLQERRVEAGAGFLHEGASPSQVVLGAVARVRRRRQQLGANDAGVALRDARAA